MQTTLTLNRMTNAQKKVWKTVKTYTDLIMKGKTKEFLEHIHKDYCGWSYQNIKPINKEDLINELNNALTSRPNLFYKIKPVEIKVHVNIAVVYYCLSSFKQERLKDKQTKEKRITDILLKENNNWVLIGDYVDSGNVKQRI